MPRCAPPAARRSPRCGPRIAVLLANDGEGLLHILDEPTIGLDPDQVRGLLGELGRLAGPVVLVEHDRTAVAGVERVVEIGPEAGSGGGRVVFEGTPEELWRADTVSGRWFSGRERLVPPAGAAAAGSGARLTGRPAAARSASGPARATSTPAPSTATAPP